MSKLQESRTYSCAYVDYEEGVWDRIAPSGLVDVVTGGAVLEETLIKACWDQNALYVRFECVDTYSVSRYKNRKDPLYEEDVVEIFIDEEGKGKRYMELVVSPDNVLYDVMITHDDENDSLRFKIDREWEVEGLETTVDANGEQRIYTFRIPFSNFDQAPTGGTEWRINFFRIDDEASGTRHFQAWSPTGIVNYHVTERFGTLIFTEK